MKANPDIESEVRWVLRDFCEAYASRDLDLIMAFFPDDPDITIVAAGMHEMVHSKDAARALFDLDFSATRSGRLNFENLVITQAGQCQCPLALVSADAHFTFDISGQERHLNGPYTLVLEKRGDRWLIIQSHFSIPVQRESVGLISQRAA